MNATSGRRCTIIPPHILERLALATDDDLAARARAALAESGRAHELSHLRAGDPKVKARPRLARGALADGPVRLISDAAESTTLPGRKVRGEGDPATDDVAATEAYDGLGATWALFAQDYARNSLDGRGLPLRATVHYGRRYVNAFWDGTQMVFGDGDGVVFGRFTASLDVIAHELAHGVTEHTAGLVYRDQPGALNESMSDVFGSLVKQKSLAQNASDADWLIGAELLVGELAGQALRSMRAPGTAYDNPLLGKDPQPGHMRDFVETDDDNGGVHINSGIPNRAFFLFATALGGFAWEVAGAIWYAVLTGPGIAADCDFATFAQLTIDHTTQRYGEASPELAAVRSAWEQVGVLEESSPAPSEPDAPPASDPDAPPTSDPDAPPASDPDAPPTSEPGTVLVTRSGGFVGQTVSKTIAIADLPKRDQKRWRTILSSDTLQGLGGLAQTHPDTYCYGVSCVEPFVEVAIPEQHLPEKVRDLLERALRDQPPSP